MVLLILAAALAGVAGLLLLRNAFGDQLAAVFENPDTLRDWFSRFGAFDEAVFVLIRAAQTVVKFIPAEPLEIGAGYLWGTGWGLVYCLVGNVLGSLAILALTRRFGSRLTDRILPEKMRSWLGALERSDRLYPTLTLFYLIPGTPKDSAVYFVGLLDIDMKVFMLINTLGRIPSILMSTVCGDALGEKKIWLSAGTLVVSLILAAAGGLVYRRWLGKKAAAST